MQFGFGSGSLTAVDSGSNPTPSQFGILQDNSVDFSFSMKELAGQYAFPVAVGRGTGKIQCKAKSARLQGRGLNALFFNNSKAAGQTSVAEDEVMNVPATTAYTVTVSNGATFVDDLGVYYSATGIPLTRVAPASEALGKYSVNTTTGVYTFAVADASAVLKGKYSYTVPTTGEKISIANALIGTAPTFKSVFTQVFNSLRQTLVLNCCTASKLSMGSKLEDFMQPEMDYSAYADAGNNIGVWSLGEAS